MTFRKTYQLFSVPRRSIPTHFNVAKKFCRCAPPRLPQAVNSSLIPTTVVEIKLNQIAHMIDQINRANGTVRRGERIYIYASGVFGCMITLGFLFIICEMSKQKP